MADGLSILAAYGDAEFSDAELKVIDTAVATYAFDTTGTVTLLNGAAIGSDFTDRVGRKSMFKSVLLQGLVSPASITSVPSLNRIMLVYDNQAKGALAAVTDVLSTANAASMLNLDNRDRFEILWDEYFVTGYVTAALADQTGVAVRQYQEFDLPAIYGGTTAAVASITTGSLFMLTVGTQLAAAGATLVGAVRVRFVDA